MRQRRLARNSSGRRPAALAIKCKIEILRAYRLRIATSEVREWIGAFAKENEKPTNSRLGLDFRKGNLSAMAQLIRSISYGLKGWNASTGDFDAERYASPAMQESPKPTNWRREHWRIHIQPVYKAALLSMIRQQIGVNQQLMCA